MEIYKVTSVRITSTKKGFKVFNIQLNNIIWATKLFPRSKLYLKSDKLYLHYIENNGLGFLLGKYICLDINKNDYGYQFDEIESYDFLNDFNTQIKISKGGAFSTKFYVYDFLKRLGRKIEDDGSIKINSQFGDMRIYIRASINLCLQFDFSIERLNLNNIDIIFNQFYKDVPLSARSAEGSNSYYAISYENVGIVKMDHIYRFRYSMSKSDDCDYWSPRVVLKIGSNLLDEHVTFLKGLLVR